MRPRITIAGCALAAFLFAGGSLKAAPIKWPTPGPEDAPQLVTPGPDPVVRIPVGHQHGGSLCFGYLYFSRRSIRYEVLHPDRFKEHSFESPLSDVVVAREWTFLGMEAGQAEFKLRDGRVFHFARVRRSLAEATTEKFKADDILSWEILVDAFKNLDSVVAQAMANDILSVQAKAASAPAAPAAPAPPPLDDSTAMDSSGLDVPPPPPWRSPASAGSPGSGRP